MSPQSDILKGVVRRGATLLRGGADLLDRAAGEPRFSKEMDDQTLARKVESIIFRPADAPRGSVDVNVVDRVVYLRGEVGSPDEIRALVAKTEAIPEVERVEHLLHLPGTPAPTRSDTPASQRKPAGRRRKPKSPDLHEAEVGVTAERRSASARAEPSPAEHAATRTGRTAAPMGSKDPDAP